MSALPDENNIRRAKKLIVVKKKDGTRGKNMSPQKRAEVEARQQQALELRMSGATYGQIASSLNYGNPSSAKAAVDAAIWRTERDAAKEVVALDIARLDEYQMRCTHALRTNGDLSQIDRLMRIMEMRYRLLGISDETVRALQQDHGIVINQKNMVMNVHAAPETEDEFLRKMMGAVGVDPDSEEAKKFLKKHHNQPALPMLEGSANNANQIRTGEDVGDAEIVEAEIVEDDE